MNSSMGEQVFVKHPVKSSNLFSSANVLLADMAYAFDCKSKEESSSLSQDSVKIKIV